MVAALALFMAIAAVSCSKTTNDGEEPENRTVALVTYDGTQDVQYGDETGYVSLFTYYGENGTESQFRSTVETRLPQTLQKGQRMVVAFAATPQNYPGYPTGSIDIKSYVLVPTSGVKIVSHDEAIANNAELNLFFDGGKVSMYRTGYYLNLDVYMPNFTEREFILMADEATVNTEMPDLYLSTVAKGEGLGYVSKTLVSLNLYNVWRNPVVMGVKLHVNNSAGNEQKTFTITKY